MPMSKINTLVSIIVPVYNGEKYLRECLASIVSQTYKKLEVIIIDDGSTDDSSLIYGEYLKRDKRFRLKYKKNGGVSSARNLGLGVAKGGYVAFVDCDDTVGLDYIETLVNLANTHEADVVACTTTHNIRTIKMSQDSETYPTKVFTPACAIRNMLYQKSITNGPHAKLFSSKILKNLKFREDLTIGEDIEFNYRAMLRANIVVYIPRAMYEYRQHANSALHADFKPNKLDEIYAAESIMQDSQLLDDSLTKLAAVNRCFAAALFVAVQITDGADRQYLKVCLEKISKYKKQVLIDNYSRIGYRILALAAFCGASTPLRLMKFRTKIKGIFK